MIPQRDFADDCSTMRELSAWRVIGDLSDEERRRVEAHLRQCDACRGFFRFAFSIKSRMDEVADHPAAAALVQYAEDPASMAPPAARGLGEHLVLCRECAAELRLLHEVQADYGPGDTAPDGDRPTAPSVPRRRPSAEEVWHRLSRTLLRPAPAAGYLAGAVILAVLLILRVGGGGENAPAGAAPGAGPAASGFVGPVVRLADERYQVRDGIDHQPAVPVLDGGRPQFLLLEFTDLEQPPDPAATYTVSVTLQGTGRPAWSRQIRGAEFRENYTLCLSLRPRSLPPGEYLVAATDSAGVVLLQGRVEVR